MQRPLLGLAMLCYRQWKWALHFSVCLFDHAGRPCSPPLHWCFWTPLTPCAQYQHRGAGGGVGRRFKASVPCPVWRQRLPSRPVFRVGADCLAAARCWRGVAGVKTLAPRPTRWQLSDDGCQMHSGSLYWGGVRLLIRYRGWQVAARFKQAKCCRAATVYH